MSVVNSLYGLIFVFGIIVFCWISMIILGRCGMIVYRKPKFQTIVGMHFLLFVFLFIIVSLKVIVFGFYTQVTFKKQSFHGIMYAFHYMLHALILILLVYLIYIWYEFQSVN